jgi:2-polyprenyl-6-methoxyphenol hydroxylase-like FAD-dependent oxidoreductase
MNYDVLIVGAGPSGLTVAAELASAGVRAVVLERRTEVVQSRAGTILPRVLELFDARGVVDRFIERTREINDYPFRHAHIWAGFQPIDWTHINSRFGFTLGLPQTITEEILFDWATECGADIRRNMDVVAINRNDDGVWVEASDTAGKRQRFHGRYLVGADGGRSIVRQSAGIAFDGHSGTFRGIAVDAELEVPWPERVRMTDNEMGWAVGYAFGPGITRFNIVHRDRRAAAKDEPVTVEEVCQCLRDIYGDDYGIQKFHWASRFDDQMRCVPSLRKENIFLVGESARVHYPASGVGMNFCLQDAFNLGWKLASVIRGMSPPAILDTYDAERMPVIKDLLSSVAAQCALQFNFSSDAVVLKRRMAERIIPIPAVQRTLGQELCGLGRAYPAPAGSHALVGHPVPDFDFVNVDGKSMRVAEGLRNQHFLLLDFEGISNQFAALHLEGLPLKYIKARVSNVPQTMATVKAMLIRPDAYVAWASDAIGNIKAVQSELFRWLLPTVINKPVAADASATAATI